MYVAVGKVGAENFDDNLKTLYITSKIRINKLGEYEHDNNTNRFLYHAGMMVVNNPDKNCGWNDQEAVCDKRNSVEYYVRLIQKVQTKEAEEVMTEFLNEDFLFKKQVSIKQKKYRSDLDNYLTNAPNKNVYVAVPKHSDVNLVSIWKMEDNFDSLELLQKTELNFVLTAGTGVISGGTSVDADKITETSFYAYNTEPTVIDDLGSLSIPIDLNLRSHHKHLMFQIGVSFNKKMGGDWMEYPQTKDDDIDIATVRWNDDCFAENDSRRDGHLLSGNCHLLDLDEPKSEEYYDMSSFAQNRYVGVGYVLGADEQAGEGYGLRLGGRIGFLDMPNATVGSVQVGYAVPIAEEQFLIDIDAQAGAMFAGSRNLMFDLYQMEAITPMFGLIISAGAGF